MLPHIEDGDYLFVDPAAYSSRGPEAGDVVVARHPYERDTIITKRVRDVSDGAAFLVSDNPDEGTDSRTYGPIRFERILGRVVARVSG